MRVLTLTTTFPRWTDDTRPRFVYDLSKHMTRRGVEVIVLAPHHEGARFHEMMEGIEVYRFPYFFPYKYQNLCWGGGIRENIAHSILAKVQVPFLSISMFVSFLFLIIRKRPDIVHAHWILPQGLFSAIVKRLFGVPFVVTAHAGDVFPLKSPILRHTAGYVLSECDYCTANSRYTMGEILRIRDINEKTSVIPMGTDSEIFKPMDKKKELADRYGITGQVILTVCRLAEKKGVNYLIDAMPKVLVEFQSAKLIIVGDGPEKPKLTEQINKLGLGKNVVFAGNIPHSKIAEYYNISDVFVLPSIVDSRGDTEGLGVVILEALMCEKPVIATSIGGITDIAEQVVDITLVPQKDADAISKGIISTLEREKIQKLDRNNVERLYGWGNIAGQFIDIFGRCLQSKK
jgi:glycosyltransferase involved in cell wall biosynthesis